MSFERGLAALAECIAWDPVDGTCTADSGSGSTGGGGYTYSGGCPVGMVQTQTGCYDPGTAGGSPGSGSGSPGFNWSAWVAGLANQWTQIGGRVIAPQTTYTRNPDGSISYSTPGSGALPSSLTSSSSSSLIWIAGAGLLLLLVVGSMKK